MRSFLTKKAALLFFIASLGVSPLLANSAFDMSIEELMSINITSFAKKKQDIKEVAAAVHIITDEDIRKSGARTIQEVLRLAPGVHSLAVHNGRWSVSIRGAAREYVNKLLVLIDGRSVYSPTFSGLLWEALEIPVENVLRIEVIRGPGASMWGANAVNGVINIVSKTAEECQGKTASILGGDKLKKSAFYRHGFKQSDDTHVRVHASGFELGESEQAGGKPGGDEVSNRNIGFRLDKKNRDESRKFSLQGNAFTSSSQDEITRFSRPPAVETLFYDQRVKSLNLSARWENQFANNRSSSFQASYEKFIVNNPLIDEHRNTFEIEYTQRFNPAARHDLVWGVGTRFTQDSIGSTKSFRLYETSKTTALYRLFFNDDITLQPDRLRLSLSAGLEHNEFTDYEFQPSARLMYTPDKNNSIWCAVSRAVRVPSRMEQGARYYYLADPRPPVPFVADTIFEKLDSEKLTSYDLGWKRIINERLSFDLTGFYFKYKDGIGSNNVSMALDPGGYAFVQRALNNKVCGDSRGVEFSFAWTPREKLNLQGFYSYIDINNAHPADTLPLDINKNVPVRTYSLLSSLDLSRHLGWNVWYRHTGSIEVGNIPGYDIVDTSLIWKARPGQNWTFAVQNLFDKDHKEFAPRFVFSKIREFGRNYYLRSEWQF